MASQNEQLQKIWHEYEAAMGHVPASARDALKWGVERGMIALPFADPYDKLVDDMHRALREEYAVDARGRRYRVNHAVRITKAGVQYTMWAIIGNAPRDHMQKAFAQRRRGVVADCVQLATDVEVYNDFNKGQPKIQIPFDFTHDVEEAMFRTGEDAA
jgi:hypothetical protein